jgi:hypothetical protein
VVTAVDGQEVTIHLSEGLSVDIGTAGTIYTTTTVGREEKSVRIAKVEVTGATRRTVTVRVTEQTQVPETGFSVSFKTVERPATLRLDDTLHVTVRPLLQFVNFECSRIMIFAVRTGWKKEMRWSSRLHNASSFKINWTAFSFFPKGIPIPRRARMARGVLSLLLGRLFGVRRCVSPLHGRILGVCY